MFLNKGQNKEAKLQDDIKTERDVPKEDWIHKAAAQDVELDKFAAASAGTILQQFVDSFNDEQQAQFQFGHLEHALNYAPGMDLLEQDDWTMLMEIARNQDFERFKQVVPELASKYSDQQGTSYEKHMKEKYPVDEQQASKEQASFQVGDKVKAIRSMMGSIQEGQEYIIEKVQQPALDRGNTEQMVLVDGLSDWENADAFIKVASKKAAYEEGDSMADTIEKDYQLRVSGLSDFNLAEMITEYSGTIKEKYNEEKAKQLESVKNNRGSSESKLLKLLGDHSKVDVSKAFEKFKSAEVKQPDEKDLYGPEFKPGKQNWEKSVDYKAPKDADKQDGMAAHEEEKGQVGKDASKKKAEEKLPEELQHSYKTFEKAMKSGEDIYDVVKKTWPNVTDADMEKLKKHYKTKEASKKKADDEKLNGYIGYYKGKQFETRAKSSYDAQQQIAKEHNIKKSYEITIVLAEKGGEPVTHKPQDVVGFKKKADYLSSEPEYGLKDFPEERRSPIKEKPIANDEFDENSPEALGESFVNGNISYVRKQIANNLQLFNSTLQWLEEYAPDSIESFRRLMTQASKEDKVEKKADELENLEQIEEPVEEPVIDDPMAGPPIEEPKKKVDDKITKKIDEKIEEKTEEIADKIEEKIEEHQEEMEEKIEQKIDEQVEESFEEHHEKHHGLPLDTEPTHEDAEESHDESEEKHEEPEDYKEDNKEDDKKEEEEEEEIEAKLSKKKTVLKLASLSKVAEVDSPWAIIKDEQGNDVIAKTRQVFKKKDDDDEEKKQLNK